MAQLLHGSAKSTYALRPELQRSQAPVAQLFGIEENTVLKWRLRQSVDDLPMGSKKRRGCVHSWRRASSMSSTYRNCLFGGRQRAFCQWKGGI